MNMDKKEIQKRVLQNGEPLDLDKFTWDKDTKTFSSLEDNLVLDFNGIDYCVFSAGSDCVFKTGSGCIFKTGSNCVFDTGSGCVFSTSSYCIFSTGFNCAVVRRDVYGVIELKENQKIKLNGWNIKGYKILDEEEKSLSGKKVKVELDGKSYTATID